MVASWRSITVTDAVRDLYRARWGEPSRRAQFSVGDLDIEVLKWNAGTSTEGVALYATLGASSRPTKGRDPNHRVEFFVGLLPEKDEVASSLAALGLYSAREGIELDHGHTVPADIPLWPGSKMSAFLVMRPRVDFLPALDLSEGLHVEFLHAIPIFESDRAFKSKYGAEAMMKRWEEAGVAFWDPGRPETLIE
jgi:Suppressor of fused protein (SUFU)